ncbi:hypothetical protein KIL84_012820 [Mauremys mutica]|uniref:Uncharacterized protein n=1 Tax=Mauremys mutica TaxID=74926 RepID=A0A9D3XQF4_9SAUR|nr:hypothetical protein KIL84_012820 [Mauremys mutica]
MASPSSAQTGKSTWEWHSKCKKKATFDPCWHGVEHGADAASPSYLQQPGPYLSLTPGKPPVEVRVKGGRACWPFNCIPPQGQGIKHGGRFPFSKLARGQGTGHAGKDTGHEAKANVGKGM